MAGKPQTLSKGQAAEVVTIFRKQLLTWGLVFLTLLTGITGLSLWAIKNRVETIAIQRIAKQFEEPHISDLMEQVAKKQAKFIIEQQVEPVVTRFKNEINNKIGEFDNYLTNLKIKYERDYETLSTEIAVLKKRNEIMKLGDLGTHAAERSALEELEKTVNESKDTSVKTAASSEIARIKAFWTRVTRLKGQEISGIGPTGNKKKEKDFTTDEIIHFMLSHPEWQIRALSAQALHKRKEKGVPTALLSCIEHDRNLEVVRDAVRSFQRVTGYDSPDVFSFEIVNTWWTEHSEEITKKFKKSLKEGTEQKK